jgi:nucleoside-diphosphate-sugar epimerase
MEKCKTILVTGATGLIGSHIIEKLLIMDNVHVIALSHNESKLDKMFGNYSNNDLFEYVVADMGNNFDFASISKDRSIDVIFHAASPISGKIVNERPVDVIRPNLIALETILEGLVTQKNKTGICGRIIIFSSATVYGISNSKHDITVNEFDTKYSESLDSANAPYSESKRMAEVIARAYARQYNVDAVIARLGWVYGATLFPPETALYEFINNALLCKDIRIKNSDSPKRDNIFIEDAVSGLFTILENGEKGEAYNVSSGGEYNSFSAIDEIAEIIAKISNEVLSNKIKVIYESPKNQTRKPGVILDNSKLKSLGWKLRNGLYDGIKNTMIKQAAY